MNHRRIQYLVVATWTLAFATVFALRPMSGASPAGFNFKPDELKNKKLWTKVNAQPYYISSRVDMLCRAPTRADYENERKLNPHAGAFITVYVNNIGRNAMFSKEPQRFPKGSVIVKEKTRKLREGDLPVLYTVMVKRERGYNPDVGDWEFLVASAESGEIQASGKLENCQTCHVAKPESDFVFRPYVKSTVSLGTPIPRKGR